jgi:hypothetical protein
MLILGRPGANPKDVIKCGFIPSSAIEVKPVRFNSWTGCFSGVKESLVWNPRPLRRVSGERCVGRSRDTTLSSRRPSVRLADLQAGLRTRLINDGRPLSVIRVAETLFSSPYVTAPGLVRQLGVSFPTAQKAIEMLAEDIVLAEVTGRSRDRLYLSPNIFDAVYGDVEVAEGRDSEAPLVTTESAEAPEG